MKVSILIMDLARCHGCNNCFMACKDEFVDNDFLPHSVAQPRHGHRWINLRKKESGKFPMVDVAYLAHTCQQCENAPCIEVGQGAVVRNHYGVVEINPITAKNNKAIIEACPYEAVYWNDESQVAQKCNFCTHLLVEHWKKPRCVIACPTEALQYVRVEESKLEEYILEHSLEVLHPEFNTKPHVFYKNLYRYTKHFVGGSITHAGQCLENAVVHCYKKGMVEPFTEALTNTYGEFKIDRLNTGEYLLEISCSKINSLPISFEIKDESIYLGTIEL